ncbi:lytic murein transglycosylase B [Steroidobacter sp.]|uniref:lytic murein transglycosylase B n=1 Tax=Steroidobacter sp. TaxID=1978227 RepID=UPI001A3BB2AF|nr:lytic murein transglycosylase B [Steroidobacter sp.]MBL8271075.1 lytic murein transglycosylase B [Steroidobacter sp.]
MVVKSLRFAALTLLAGALCSPAANAEYLARPEVREFIEAMQAEHGMDVAELERVLGEARYQPVVSRLIGPERPKPVTPPVRSYPKYRAKFLTKSRIAAGTQFWDLHEADLRRAQAEFGVPPEVVLGILGVETAFGQNTGSFRVVDSLATIAFDGPRRQEYFRDELKELLLLSRELSIDPLKIKGSYAGAMGLPQFMPSSYRKYAVDFDQDGSIDLVGSSSDAIGSIGSYLKAFGWVDGEAALVPVRLPAGSEAELVSGLERTHEVAALQEKGVRFSIKKLPEGACSVVELPTPGKPSKYVAGFSNFDAITRYNRSTFYATAVLDLATAIHDARTQITASR